MMGRENASEGSVCTDCHSLIAKGNAPDDWSESKIAEWLEDIEERLRGVDHVTLGHFHDSDRCSHAGEPCEEDCDCERTDFGTSPCDHCGSHLAGTRDDVTFWVVFG